MGVGVADMGHFFENDQREMNDWIPLVVISCVALSSSGTLVRLSHVYR